MARIKQEEDHARKRAEIARLAWGPVLRKGYEKTTIQDVLDESGISKGAFFHYFASKHDLLDEMIAGMVEMAREELLPLMEMPDADAVTKLTLFFRHSAGWKVSHKDQFRTLLQAWYLDENVLVREKNTRDTYQRFMPFFEDVINQGYREGAFSVPFTVELGYVLTTLMTGMGNQLAAVVMRSPAGAAEEEPRELFEELSRISRQFNEVIEKVLGAAPGSLQLVDLDMLAEWLK